MPGLLALGELDAIVLPFPDSIAGAYTDELGVSIVFCNYLDVDPTELRFDASTFTRSPALTWMHLYLEGEWLLSDAARQGTFTGGIEFSVPECWCSLTFTKQSDYIDRNGSEFGASLIRIEPARENIQRLFAETFV